MKTFNFLLTLGFLVIMVSCSKEDQVVPAHQEATAMASSDQIQFRQGATRISGVGTYADVATCDYPGEGADFALYLTGDLNGCLFVYVDNSDCSPSGTYRERGREYFVGTYDGAAGTFWTSYFFSGKFEGCEDGFFVGAEIFGRCQHPITAGSGTGVFDGVSGRVDIKDDVANGTFPYKGHLKF